MSLGGQVEATTSGDVVGIAFALLQGWGLSKGKPRFSWCNNLISKRIADRVGFEPTILRLECGNPIHARRPTLTERGSRIHYLTNACNLLKVFEASLCFVFFSLVHFWYSELMSSICRARKFGLQCLSSLHHYVINRAWENCPLLSNLENA